MMDTIKNWIANNKTIAYVIGGLIALVFVGKAMKPKPRRRRKTSVKVVNKPRRRSVRTVNKPRRRSTTKGTKKPWQIKGSLAAKRHMAKLRRMR